MARTPLATSNARNRARDSAADLGAVTIAPDAVGEIQFHADVDPTHYLDPEVIIYCDVLILAADGVTWEPCVSNRPDGWRGGAYTDDDGIVNPPPILCAFDAQHFRGRTLRPVFTVSRRDALNTALRTSFGATIETRER